MKYVFSTFQQMGNMAREAFIYTYVVPIVLTYAYNRLFCESLEAHGVVSLTPSPSPRISLLKPPMGRKEQSFLF